MNSLNLRVSTVKSGENVKKNAEMRTTPVPLPQQYEAATELYCIEFKNAKSIPQQVTVVKNIFQNLDSDPQALQFLADLYFQCPLKHPVRNQILKFLITAARVDAADVDDGSIVYVLALALQNLLQLARTDIESGGWNAAVTSLSGCFENFKCGQHALEQCLDVVLPFLCGALQKYLTELSVLSSPSVRNEYYLYVHNSIRLILSCVQEFGQKLHSTQGFALQQLNIICKKIILDDEMPMDPRTNSGILMAHIAKLFGEYDSFIQAAKLTNEPNEIALCIGIVNTCDQLDFQQYSADIRDICNKIEQIANEHATTHNILLCAARSLYQYSKIILAIELNALSTMNDAKLILRKLLMFAFSYLEHHMDSVRHICRDLLKNIVAAARKIKFDFLLKKIYDACNSERLSLSMKCVVLQQLVAVLGAESVISNSPTLFSCLFAEHLGREFIVNNLFEALMCASHKELSYEAWFKLWIQYLLNISQEYDTRLADIELLVVKAVKCEPQLVEHIIEETDNNIPISTKLSALWAMRKAGIKLDNFGEIMQKFSKYLLLSILGNCDDTRIMALRLLVETHKTTEPLSALECEHLLTYLEYNANAQSPATRQKTVSLMSKALVRYELTLIKVQKRQSSTAGDTASAKQPLQHKFLMDFLLDFMRILVSNLFEGANFSRRAVSLLLLEQALRICINCNLNLLQILPEHTIEALTVMLGDSYETNKELAVVILKLLESKLELSLIKTHNLHINLQQLQQLLSSVRPTDSVTAAYQLDFYCNRAESFAFGEFELPAYSAIHFAAIRWLLLQLRNGLKLAKKSILQAAKLQPLYGLLFAVKHLLQRLNVQVLAQQITWRMLIAELIVLCKELTSVVAPIVNSSSPEGHLPNDFSDLSSEFAAQFKIDVYAQPHSSQPPTISTGATRKTCNILSSMRNSQQLDLQQLRTTPQMVLLCAWRTVKEVSLILGDLVLRAPIQYSQLTVHFLLTKEQILEIGAHFKQLLAETKHRGAFEQAYVGFAKLCCRLWRVEVEDLNSLPMQWLRELLAVITNAEQTNEKMCATRRSAGVPFMAQALITAELQVGTTKSLHICMAQLLQLCNNAYSSSSTASTSSSVNTERSVEARTHALNILRALFRCTDLSEAVCEFVSDGVMCAIHAYDADTWSERNSATLLFSALITRIFGVQRTKDTEHLNIRNKMTGRVFFLRYPKLYDFFLAQLRGVSDLIKSQQHAHKLHPLLLILSRLYPSALEGTESNLKLSAFIPYISDCAGCPEMQTRYLAAKAVVAIISRGAVVQTILRKCADIVATADDPATAKNLNILHGQLLQVLLLLKSLLNPTVELISDISCTLVTFHEKTQIKNAVILKVVLDIFIEMMHSLETKTIVPQTTIQQLLYFSSKKKFYDAKLSHYYVVLHKSFYIYNLHTLRLTLPFGAFSDYLQNPPITHGNVQQEQAETCLNIILLVLMAYLSSNTPADGSSDVNCHGLTSDDIEEYEIPAVELQLVSVMNEEMIKDISTDLRNSKRLQLSLTKLVQEPLYYPACVMKAYAILSLLDHFDFTLSFLVTEAKHHSGDIKSQLTMCVERVLLLQRTVDLKTAHICLEYLTEIAQPWQPDTLRWKAAKIFAHVAGHYPNALEKKKLPFVRLYISLMLTLLMDDDFDVRDSAAKMVLNSLPDDNEMENVVSTMAQRLFITYTADILLTSRVDDAYILQIFRAIAETMRSTKLPDDNNSDANQSCVNTSSADLDIFDKNEANVFAEPLKAIKDAVVVFKNTFKEHPKIVNFINDYKV